MITDKSLELKKKQHYVWARYMQRWSPNNRDVWYSTKNKKIAFDSVKGIVFEPYFYKAQRLTAESIVYLKVFIMQSYGDEGLQKLLFSYLDQFEYVQKLEETNQYDKDKSKIIEAYITNNLENIHSAHEEEMKPILKALATGDQSILQEDGKMVFFLHFLSHQLFRTKTVKEKILIRSQSSDSKLYDLLKDNWWFVGYMLGMGLGTSLFTNMDDYKHCLLINNTNIPFITSDQPVINVHQDLIYDTTVPNNHVCDIYYPISPTVAYMVNKSDRFLKGANLVSSEVVDEMNIKMANQANVHIISNDEDIVKNYQKYIGYQFGEL